MKDEIEKALIALQTAGYEAVGDGHLSVTLPYRAWEQLLEEYVDDSKEARLSPQYHAGEMTLFGPFGPISVLRGKLKLKATYR